MKNSILANKKTILQPNSEFERRNIFQNYLDSNIKITNQEREILLECVALEPENIGIIGCLLNDKTYLNTLRLKIGSINKSNVKLAQLSKELLVDLDVEAAFYFYFVNNNFDTLTKVEVDVTNVYVTFC